MTISDFVLVLLFTRLQTCVAHAKFVLRLFGFNGCLLGFNKILKVYKRIENTIL